MKFYKDSLLHNPKLELQNNDNAEKITDKLSEFVLTAEQMIKMKNTFTEEMKNGLEKNPSKKSCLLMMNTYITKLLDGTETGDYLSLDLGSTNFRVCHLKLNGNKYLFNVKYYDIPGHCKSGSADPLFDHIAGCVKDFMDTILHYKAKEPLPLGFTFSFPCIQNSINSGLLTTWTKNYDIPEVVNNDPVYFLQRSLDKFKVNSKVVALINDSTGTLMKGIFLNKECKLGVIMGTGFNICYVENDCTKIKKWEEERLAKFEDVKNVLIDIECGAFGDNGCIDFIKTKIDHDVDAASLFPGSFAFEKMFSGKFLGEIVLRILKSLVEEDLILKGKVTKQFEKLDSISSRQVVIVDSDESTHTAEDIFKNLGYITGEYTIDDLSTLKYVCRIVLIRCACLVSSVFASIIEWLNEPNSIIAIDGSLYKNNDLLKKLIRDYLFELTGGQKKFDIILAEDGSGKGAGIVAALSNKIK